MSWKEEQIDNAKKVLLKKEDRNNVIDFEWWETFEDLSRLSFKENATNLAETLAEAIDNVLAKLSEGCLRLFENETALDVCNICYCYSPYGYKGDRAERSIAQVPYPNAWIATGGACLKNWKMRVGHRQKMFADR